MSVLEVLRDLQQMPAPRETSLELIEEMRALHACGQPADAWAVLACHPEVMPDKMLLTDLATEEFVLRSEAGEKLDYVAFAARFPAIDSSLRQLLVLHTLLAEGVSPLLLSTQALPWPEVGDTVMGFDLLHELGHGSFARVFLAAQPTVGDRRVVVKLSCLNAAAEADALGSLSHPNVVPILSLHTDAQAGWTAVCMTYHGTATLADVFDRLSAQGGRPRHARAILEAIATVPCGAEPMREGAGPPAVLRHGSYLEGALHLAAQLADAVSYVHEQKIWHSDLKPANVLLTPNGRPLLLDFNLSCNAEAETQDVGGTLTHMAPEQVRALLNQKGSTSQEIDGRSDVFALGVLLYQLFTGKHPFLPFPKNLRGRQLGLWLLRRHQEGALPVRTLNAQLDRAVAQLLDRCLSLDPNQRPTAHELAEAFRRAQSVPRRAVRSMRAHARTLLGVAAVTLFALLYTLLAPLFAAPLEAGEQAYREGHYQDAVKHFSEVLKQEGASARVLFARGRAYVRLGELDDALRDFKAADELGKDGKVKAALGTLYLAPGPMLDYNAAAYYYDAALKANYQTARVYNNLGFVEGQRGRLLEARINLARALELDPSLQAAYYNRALLKSRQLTNPSRQAIRFLPLFGQPLLVPVQVTLGECPQDAKRSLTVLRREVLPDLEEAIKRGPESAELHLDTAIAFAVAAQLGADAQLGQKALFHAARAIDLGCHPRELRGNGVLAAGLREHLEEFAVLLQRPPLHSPARRTAVRVLDPLED